MKKMGQRNTNHLSIRITTKHGGINGMTPAEKFMKCLKPPILHKTGHDRGRIHDYEIFKNKHPTTPPQVEKILDLGYLGVKNDFPTVKYEYLRRFDEELYTIRI
jgi:hypothetical protein